MLVVRGSAELCGTTQASSYPEALPDSHLERTESPAEAEVISRQALSLYPNNPWGLYALLESLKKQNRGAAEVQ